MKKHRISLDYCDWPILDQNLWDAALAEGDFLEDERGAAAHWREPTRRQTIKGYGLWMFHLEKIGRLEPDSLPSERVTKETLQTFVEDLTNRVASTTATSRVRDLREAIRVMEPEADTGLLKKTINRLQARQKPSRNKAARVIHPGRAKRTVLGNLPDIENRPCHSAVVRASWFRDAVLLLILITRAPRRLNLAMMRIGRHLLSSDDGYRCVFEPDEMKDGRRFEFHLPQDVSEVMTIYLTKYRPLLVSNAKEDHVFLTVRRGPIAPHSLSKAVRAASQRELGVDLSPHLFRDSWATSIANDDPEHVQIAARGLAHRSMTNTEAHYIHAEMGLAVEQFQSEVCALIEEAEGG